ncbi:hypothetical protein BDA99DRAFT_252211 [Phascolomyces articulosus]|uniref:Uncharacterized protein n=1 Tax=Phascolomyces articulosus TaxID=60185 RepID=A0AAD5P8Z1_9FUNG|nr:hypothetical protein BDA99DRAFT_252211 [Phascolomyces articulosus]
MKNNDLSSEKIAKALKGAGLSVQDRILTATEAWSNNQLFFPNKDDFLFEWLCTALIKTKVKSSTECAAFQIAYWRLFHQLLAHYHQRAHTTQKPPPAIRVQLIAVITALLGHLNTTNHDDDAKDILLELYACVDLLLSPTFSLSYRPTFEQMSTTIDQLMDTLMRVINNNKQSTAMLGPLLKVAHVLLIRYSTQLTQTANQRKSFTTIVEKILAKFLCVRRRILLVPFHELAQTISNQVTDIIVKALFHPDVVMEYTSVLKKDTSSTQQQSSSKNKNSYVAKLFEELSRLLENKKDQHWMSLTSC